MNKQTEPLETLSEIRSMMERSTRFISLNGLSGVFAGIFALLGALAAYVYLKISFLQPDYYQYSRLPDGSVNFSFYIFFFTDALLVLFASIFIAVSFCTKKARKNGVNIWDSTSKRLLINLMIPLIFGGLFCLVLVYHGHIGYVAPVMLLFYGLSLVNASKYTLPDIRFLGITEASLGIISAIWIGYGLLFWALGFGLVHIVYGIMMYYKYER
jgi:hypothetical protein